MSRGLRLVAAATIGAALVWCAAQTLAEDEKPSGDSASTWISEDIVVAYAQAKETGKPLLVSFK